MLRIAFFGTPDFAVPTLEALLESRHDVVAVVTQPDRPRGRGRHLAEPPVKGVARRAGIPVLQPERLKDDAWLQQFRRLAADLAVVAAFGKLLPQALLDIPPRGFLNVHASLLPRYRGASPIQRAVMNGDRETGVTIMRIVLALDAGPMLARCTRAIGPEETSAQVEVDLAAVGARLLVDTLDGLEAGTVVETPQAEADATYAPRLTKDDGLVDWGLPALVLHNRVRGLQPWPLAYTYLASLRLVLARTRVSAVAGPASAEPGQVLLARGDDFVVAAGEGTSLALLEVQPEGRRVMSARDFLAGHPIAGDARLGDGGR